MKNLYQSEGYELSTGELIDRLSIVNIKMWHLDSGISEAKEQNDKDRAGQLAILSRELNFDRTALREEINRRVDGRGKGTDKIEYTIGRGIGNKK